MQPEAVLEARIRWILRQPFRTAGGKLDLAAKTLALALLLDPRWPSERVLARSSGMSRGAARKALLRLAAAGRLNVQHESARRRSYDLTPLLAEADAAEPQ